MSGRTFATGAEPVFPSLERVKEDDKFAAYLKTFITRISAVTCPLREETFKE